MNILVTGAGSGIGAGVAHGLAKAGHRVVVTDLDAAAARKVADEIRAAGGSVDAVALDVPSDASVAALVQSLPRPVEVLVNNAGLQFVSRLEEFPMEKWALLVEVTLTGIIAFLVSPPARNITGQTIVVDGGWTAQ